MQQNLQAARNFIIWNFSLFKNIKGPITHSFQDRAEGHRDMCKAAVSWGLPSGWSICITIPFQLGVTWASNGKPLPCPHSPNKILQSIFYETLLSSPKKKVTIPGSAKPLDSPRKKKCASYLPTLSIKTAWKGTLVAIFIGEDTQSNCYQRVFMEVTMDYLKNNTVHCSKSLHLYMKISWFSYLMTKLDIGLQLSQGKQNLITIKTKISEMYS